MSENIILSPHSQFVVQREANHQRKEAFDKFLGQLSINTLKGASLGFVLGSIFRKKLVFISIGAGMGAGVSINLTANDFNKIQEREYRAYQSTDPSDKDDFIQRLEQLQQQMVSITSLRNKDE